MSHYDTLNFAECQRRLCIANADGNARACIVFVAFWITVVGFALFGGWVNLG